MRDFTFEIEQAKKETQARANKEIKNWFVSQWDTGFIVCDQDQLSQLPKTKLSQILNLGIKKGSTNNGTKQRTKKRTCKTK